MTTDTHSVEELRARREGKDLAEPLPYWLAIGPITWAFSGHTPKHPVHVHFDGGRGLALCEEHFVERLRGLQWLTSEVWDDVTCRNCLARKGWNPQPIKVVRRDTN
jgi:hypothetical protein